MALFKAERHTWDFPESVNADDFVSNSFGYRYAHSLHAANGAPGGVCWDGTYFYVMDEPDDSVYKYTSDWVYVSVHALHINNDHAYGFCWDGTYFYVTDWAARLIYKYDSTWTYVRTHALDASNTLATGVCWDGTYFYVSDSNGDKVCKYNSSWTYLGDSYLHANNNEGTGITWDGTYFYVTDHEDDLIYVYDSTLTYVTTYEVHASNTNAGRICWDGAYFYVTDITGVLIYEYNGPNLVEKAIAGHNNSIVVCHAYYDAWAAAHMTGNVEFWLRAKNAASKVGVILKDGTGNACINVKIDADKIIGDGSDALDPAKDHTWYRIRVDFNCTANTYDLYVDSVLKLNDKAFGVNDDGSGLTKLEFDLTLADNGYVDAIGYDWDAGYSVGDNASDTIDVTDDITYCKIKEELGVESTADLKIKGTAIEDFEAGHEIDFYDSDVVLSWIGRILYPEEVLEGTETVGKLKLLGTNSQFNNTYRKNFTTARDSDYVLKNVIDNYLTRYHSYDDEIDNFTITYKYDLKNKIQKMMSYLSMLERAVIGARPGGEVFFNKYDNLTASGTSWNQATSDVKIVSYTPAANRHVTRAPVIGANNNLGQVYYVGRATEDEEDQFGINELQVWRDPEITNYAEAKQLGDNLQDVYSLDTQMISLLTVKKKHVQVGHTIEFAWTGLFNISIKDFLVTKRVWYPMIDLCEIDLTDNILTRKSFNVRVINKFYDEDAQQSYDEPDVAESTVDGTVMPLTPLSQLRARLIAEANSEANAFQVGATYLLKIWNTSNHLRLKSTGTAGGIINLQTPTTVNVRNAADSAWMDVNAKLFNQQTSSMPESPQLDILLALKNDPITHKLDKSLYPDHVTVDTALTDGSVEKGISLGAENKMIIKAVQELAEKNKVLEARIVELEK